MPIDMCCGGTLIYGRLVACDMLFHVCSNGFLRRDDAAVIWVCCGLFIATVCLDGSIGVKRGVRFLSSMFHVKQWVDDSY